MALWQARYTAHSQNPAAWHSPTLPQVPAPLPAFLSSETVGSMASGHAGLRAAMLIHPSTYTWGFLQRLSLLYF